MRKKFSQGIGLIEVVIGAAIILSIITILVAVNNMYLRVSSSSVKTVKAQMFLQEGIEAIRLIRDQGWTASIAPLSKNSNYYFIFDMLGNKWGVTTTPQYADGMNRSFVLQDVYRNANGDIVPSGGNLDEGSRKVVIKVEWLGYSSTSTASSTTYITNLYKD